MLIEYLALRLGTTLNSQQGIFVYRDRSKCNRQKGIYMTREEIAKKAVEYKNNGHNCAQAVARAIAEARGMDSEGIVFATAGFGAGMGTMQATCGALVGANMMAGVETNGARTVMKAKNIFNEFNDMCGATICKDLKGVETGKVLCSCDQCVMNAVLAYEKIMNEQN